MRQLVQRDWLNGVQREGEEHRNGQNGRKLEMWKKTDGRNHDDLQFRHTISIPSGGTNHDYPRLCTWKSLACSVEDEEGRETKVAFQEEKNHAVNYRQWQFLSSTKTVQNYARKEGLEWHSNCQQLTPSYCWCPQMMYTTHSSRLLSPLQLKTVGGENYLFFFSTCLFMYVDATGV